MDKKNFVKAISELRKQEAEKHKQRKFDQTVDLIVNLRNFDVRKNAINSVITLPHNVKEKKVAAFLEKKSGVIDTILKDDFDLYQKDPKKLKALVDSYDFFISNAKLMPAVATTFGRVLGPAGKMPSPQIGVIPNETDDAIKNVLGKINAVIKIRQKDPSIRLSIGKQASSDEDIAENAEVLLKEIFKRLPRQKENIRSILIKFTMSKPIKVDF